MSQLTSQSLCVLGMIVAVAIIPKYITLPEGLELLFQDRIGQLLLLGLAVAIGSYNFTCGLFLAVLFLSIMLKPTKIQHEGFSDFNEDDDMELEDFEDNPVDETKGKKVNKPSVTISSNKPVVSSSKPSLPPSKSVSPKTKTSTKPSISPLDETPENNSNMNQSNRIQYDEDAQNSMVSPTPDVNQLKMQLDTSQEIIKDLEKKLNNYQSTDSKNKKTSVNVEDEPTIEPFSCGCDSDDARVTLIKYQKANEHNTIENFTNVENMDLFDVAGCKYDMGFKSQNDTYYGPPVSSCAAYNKINLDKTGTVFYPLN
jgi:hypothetical protein